MNRSISLDEEGFFLSNGLRVQDENYGHALYENMERAENGAVLTSYEGQNVMVEAFDEPLVVKQIHRLEENRWQLQMPYDFKVEFKISLEEPNLFLDEWDRFLGILDSGLNFVFSRSAQADFFNLVDDYDDDGIFLGDHRVAVPDWFIEHEESKESGFWTDLYNEGSPRWDLDTQAPILADVLPQLKLLRCRILVLGCGNGHDAAYLAKAGHIVTGVDFSEKALANAKEKYGESENLNWFHGSVFDLPKNWDESFDVIFEHTLYCAIPPSQRSTLVKTWHRLLTENGHLLGEFFVGNRREGPPFGGSEWELRNRLRRFFNPLYWTRWKNTTERRQGLELAVYAQKKNL